MIWGIPSYLTLGFRVEASRLPAADNTIDRTDKPTEKKIHFIVLLPLVKLKMKAFVRYLRARLGFVTFGPMLNRSIRV